MGRGASENAVTEKTADYFKLAAAIHFPICNIKKIEGVCSAGRKSERRKNFLFYLKLLAKVANNVCHCGLMHPTKAVYYYDCLQAAASHVGVNFAKRRLCEIKNNDIFLSLHCKYAGDKSWPRKTNFYIFS